MSLAFQAMAAAPGLSNQEPSRPSLMRGAEERLDDP